LQLKEVPEDETYWKGTILSKFWKDCANSVSSIAIKVIVCFNKR
jgi:hypothetical protein